MSTDPNLKDSNAAFKKISCSTIPYDVTIKNELYEPEIGKLLRETLESQDKTKRLIAEMQITYEMVVDRTLFGDQPILHEPNCKTQLGQELWQALQNQKQINTLLEVFITSCEL